VRDVVNPREEPGSADDEAEVPDGKRGGLDKLRCEACDTSAMRLQRESADTHKESLKSKSTGAGGLFGDCQNKPEEGKNKPLYSLLLTTTHIEII